MVYNVTSSETQPTLWNHINGTHEEILDRHCVAELARGWPVYRDSSEWTHYRDCFAEEGGYVFTTWSGGLTIDDFIKTSIEGRANGDFIMHREIGTLVDLNPSMARAVAKMKATITQRFGNTDDHDEIEYDVECDCRFIVFCQKFPGRPGPPAWKIKYIKLIYEKDRIVPVDGRSVPRFEKGELEKFPYGYRYLGASQARLGHEILTDLPVLNNQGFDKMYEAMNTWLKGTNEKWHVVGPNTREGLAAQLGKGQAPYATKFIQEWWGNSLVDRSLALPYHAAQHLTVMSDGKEIISIHVGEWGIDLGTNFWKSVLSEHGIDNSGRSSSASDLQLERLGVYFNNTKDDYYVPRGIFTDLDPISRERFHGNTVHELLPEQNKIYGQSSCHNNWAKGFYGADAGEATDKTLDALRREAEQCDSLQGIQMTHGIFAGTGGGMGSLMLSRLAEEYPEIHQLTASVLPTYSVDDGCVIRPYNTVLSLQYLAEHADLTWLFSHWAMGNKIIYQLKMDHSWALYNRIIADIMSGATTSLRLPTNEQGSSDLTQFINSLVPTSPRLHFLTSKMAPVYGSQAHNNPVLMTTTQLARELCQDRMWTTSCNQTRSQVHGRCLAYSVIFRGPNASVNDIEQFFHNARDRTSPDFVEWMPAKSHLHVSPVPAAGYESETAAFGIGNFTSVREELEDTLQMFETLFRRRSFLHFYTDHGMDQMEFVDAASVVTDLIEEYKMAESDTVTQ